jgi:hypothetical protein
MSALLDCPEIDIPPVPPDEPFAHEPRERHRGGRRWNSLLAWLSIVVLLPAMGASALGWFAPDDDPPARAEKAGKQEPARERAVYDFRAGIHNFPALTMDGPGVETQAKTDAQGLRVSIPAGQADNRPIRVLFTPRIGGDFDIAVSYELLAVGKPTPRYGAGVAVRLYLDSPARPSALLTRYRKPQGEKFVAHKTIVGPDGKDQYVKNNEITATSSVGKLRLVRNGPTVQYLVADDGQPFEKMLEVALGTEDVTDVQFNCSTTHNPIELDLRFNDLVIEAERFPDGLPSADPVSSSREPDGESRSPGAWTAASLTLLMLLTFGAVGVFFFARQTSARGRRIAVLCSISASLTVVGFFVWFSSSARPGSVTPSFVEVMLGNQFIPGVEESGFYHDERTDEGPFRWTDGRAKLVVPIGEEDHPQALFVQLHRPVNTWLQIRVNDHELVNEEVTGRPVARWNRTLDLNGIDLGEKLVVEIVSNSVVPKIANPGKSEDTRALGVRVRGMKLLRAGGGVRQ